MLIWQDGEQSQDYQHEVQPRLNFCFKIKQMNKTGSNSPWTNNNACGGGNLWTLKLNKN